MVSGIIVAAGRGSRMGAEQNKVYLPLGGKPVLVHTVQAFLSSGCVDELAIVTRDCDIELCRTLFPDEKIRIVAGGATRQESVYIGLEQIKGDIAVIHDGARALVEPECICELVKACKIHGAAACGVPCKDTLKMVNDAGFIVSTVDREQVYQIQTPQVFRTEQIRAAHDAAMKNGVQVTDDCALYEEQFGPVKLVLGSYENMKLTTPEDLILAERILERRKG